MVFIIVTQLVKAKDDLGLVSVAAEGPAGWDLL